MGQRLAYWIFLGTIGLAAFFVLHSSIAFNAGAPINQSRTTIENRTAALATKLGFSTDSLLLMSNRTQHFNYYEKLQDTLGGELPLPKTLNEEGVHLTGWKVNIGTTQKEGDILSTGIDDFFSKIGRLEVQYDQQGRVRRISSNPSNLNPTFVAGDSLSAIAKHIVHDLLNYDLRNYQLNYVNIKDTLLTGETKVDRMPLNLSDNSVGNNMIFKWSVIKSGTINPASIELEVKPLIRESKASSITNIRYGVSIEKFKAMDRYEPVELEKRANISNVDLILSFSSLGLLVVFIFIIGIHFITKAQVEWRRTIAVMVTVALGVLCWRVIYFLNMMEGFLSQTSTAIFILNNLIFASAFGLYAALAYIGWEAIARSKNQEQLHLFDAFWRKRFFFQETGESLLRGYALAGVMLGLFAGGLYLLDTVYYQADSQYGFAEPSLQPKLLTINIAAFLNVALVALGHVGVGVGYLQTKFTSKGTLYLSGMILTGFLLAGSALIFGIVGPFWYDILVFTVIGVVIIYAMENTGLLTFSTAWWIFIVLLLIMPYWGSSSIDVAYVAWVQLVVLTLPLIYGFVTYRYGNSVSELAGYIPEYEERMAHHLHVEKEIEIARESQFKLMPLQPPSLPGVDVYGFFMPSFEVGGDYFDYIISKNGTANQSVLNLTIVDVSGKAMKAAMHAVFTSGLLLSRLHKDTPEAILREITPTLKARTDRQTFITCIIAQYHPANKKLRLANAGHCLPVLKRNNKAEFIQTPAPKYPLGLLETVDYETLDVELQEGDFLLFYSDGLPEAVDPKGNRFGYNELLSLVESLETDTRPSNEISLEIKRRIQKFSDYQLADDTTIICLKI